MFLSLTQFLHNALLVGKIVCFDDDGLCYFDIFKFVGAYRCCLSYCRLAFVPFKQQSLPAQASVYREVWVAEVGALASARRGAVH